MWSAKKLIIGGLAVGGVAAVGYFVYKYYRNRNDSSLLVGKQNEMEENKENTLFGEQMKSADAEDVGRDEKMESKVADNTEKEGRSASVVANKTESVTQIESAATDYTGSDGQNASAVADYTGSDEGNASVFANKTESVTQIESAAADYTGSDEGNASAFANKTESVTQIESAAADYTGSDEGNESTEANKTESVTQIESAAADYTGSNGRNESTDANKNESVGENKCVAAVDNTGSDEKMDPEVAEMIRLERLAGIDMKPIPRPRFLQHCNTVKEMEMTIEALAAFLFTQNRSAEELKEAEKELGWWWNMVLAFRSRLPENVPLLETNDDILPSEDINGMQTVD